MFTYEPNPGLRAEKGKTINRIETPPLVAATLYRLTRHLKPKAVFDPACGGGNLLLPWIKNGTYTFGVDIDPNWIRPQGMGFWLGPFENYPPDQDMFFKTPDLVVCNPPWSGHWQNANYTEVFVRKIVTLFGPKIPLVLLCPMGFRLNQRAGSSRARWLADTLEISSIISCPANLYPTVDFHNEILLFNIKRVKPHYWIEKEINKPVPYARRSPTRT